MDVTGDSDGDDVFGGDESGVFEQIALIEHRMNELFGFEPENSKAIRHLPPSISPCCRTSKKP
jgi:hypothetical protein